MTYKQAIQCRRKYEKTVKVIKHKESCMYSDGTIIPLYPCTCGSKEIRYCNVMKD